MLGNVDGGRNGWLWEQHAVVHWQGIIIDVLFGDWNANPLEISHKGKEPNDYWTSDSETIYRANDQVFNMEWKNKYTIYEDNARRPQDEQDSSDEGKGKSEDQ